MMSDREQKATWRERQETAQAAEQEAQWGMPFQDDPDRSAPERQAWEAYERGDRLFQIELPVCWVQGWIGVGAHASRVRHSARYDVLGAIEQQGWRLEHVAAAFMETGSSATKRVFASAGSTLVATHGAMVGLYVFRRVERTG